MNNSSAVGLSKRAIILTSFALALTTCLSGCAANSTPTESATVQAPQGESAPVETPQEQNTGSSLMEVEGRAVSASNSELLLRTADGEMTFSIREEDVRAIDPEHIQSHAGIESIGFKVFYRTIDGVNYVVSVEEIDGSTLGFD